MRLGKAGDGPRVQVIRILGEEENPLLASTLTAEQAAPELLGLLYRHRWQVELFFLWLKCILGCRHWLVESPQGVALQAYLALIAAQLLVLYSGQRPNCRQMEAIQFCQLGWCDEHELVAQLQRCAPKRKQPERLTPTTARSRRWRRSLCVWRDPAPVLAGRRVPATGVGALRSFARLGCIPDANTTG